MLIQLGEARGGGADRHLAWSLAGVAGALNAAGFYAADLYSSNMSGNVSALSYHLALADLGPSGTYMSLVAIFTTGAAVSALLINSGRRRQIAGIYALSILTEAILLAALACADLWLRGKASSALLAYGLSFLMGLQNAVVTRISDARVRTTHVTGMITDIGIELGNLIDLAWQRRAWRRGWRADRAGEGNFDKDKLRLHGFTVLSFLGGGIAGALCYRRLGPAFLLGIALLLFLLALPGVLARTARPTQSRTRP